MKLTLMHKGLLLVSIPVCFEIGMFSMLIGLQEELEREAQRLDHKRQVNEAVNMIIRDVAKVGLVKKRYLQENTVTEATVRGLIDNLLKEFSKLEDLCRDDPELLHSVLLSKKAVLDAKDELRSVKVELQKVESPEQFTQVLIASRKRLDGALASALNAGVLDLANKTEQGADLEKNAQKRHQMSVVLRTALWLSVILGLLLAFWYSRGLTFRIMRLKENATLFANRKPLRPVMKGNDEIAELDRAFHETTRLIETATRKERAILENASDLIFSLDDNLIITSANPSAEATIGKPSDKLIGAPLASLIHEDDAPKIAHEFQQMLQSNNKAEFEVRLLRENFDLERNSVPLKTNDSIKNSALLNSDNLAPLNLDDLAPLNVVVSASYSPRDNSYYCILHDVTSQRQMEALRQEVVAMITHDLRTPLQTIRNYMEMLKVGMLGELNEQGSKLLGLSERESQRMTTLIDGVLTLEKLRSGNTTLNVESVDVLRLISDCANALELVAAQKKMSIKIEPFDTFEIQGDRVWLEQVLINIVSNAIKFSPPNAQVTMSVAVVGENAEIRIKDQGPGVPAEDQEKIFERFHRVSSTANKVVGSGLGLSICKELIELHRGSITCQSKPNEGSTFIIMIPLARSSGA